MNIDYRELVEQEPEIQEYIKECLYLSIVDSKESTDLFKTLVNFYTIGMTSKDVAEWMKRMQSD